MKLKSLLNVGVGLVVFTTVLLCASIKQLMPEASAILNSSASIAQSSIPNNNVTNFEGILFETVVSEQEWVVPAKEADAYTPVEFGIRVTNTTPNPIRLTRSGGLYPRIIKEPTRARPSSFELLDPEERIRAGADIDLPAQGLRESDFPMVLPGESITLSLEGKLRWIDLPENLGVAGNLEVAGNDGYEIRWKLIPLESDTTYLLWITYQGVGSSYSLVDIDILDLNVQAWNYPPQPSRLRSLAFDVYVDGQEPRDETSRRTRIEGVVGNTVQASPVRIRLVSQ